MRSETAVECIETIESDGRRKPEEPRARDDDKVESIINGYKGDKKCLLSILLDIQDECRYLPRWALELVSRRLSIPLSQVYSIATFYKAYSLEPRGEHVITVCLGTACHVRGGQRIADALGRELGIEPQQTTPDMMFTLETVNCLGACALSPVLVVDGEYHGHMSPLKIEALLAKYNQREESN